MIEVFLEFWHQNTISVFYPVCLGCSVMPLKAAGTPMGPRHTRSQNTPTHHRQQKIFTDHDSQAAGTKEINGRFVPPFQGNLQLLQNCLAVLNGDT